MTDRIDEISKRIMWEMRNKGTIHPYFMTTISAYLIFMDELSCMRERGDIEFDEKYTLKYLDLVLGKIVSINELQFFFQEIEEKLHLENKILSSGWDRIVTTVKEKDFVDFIHMIASINFESSAERYEALMRVLDNVNFQAGMGYGQFLTSLSCTKLIAALADCQQGMTVYDGYAGSGLTAIETASDKGIVYAQELNDSLGCLIAILAILKGTMIGKIKVGDSLINPIGNETYDRVICDAPIMRRFDRDYVTHIPEENYIYNDDLNNNMIFLRHSLAKLSSDGLCIAVVPMSILFSSGKMGNVRAKLINDRLIDAVIELPEKFYSNSTGIRAAILILKKNKTDDSIFMLDASRNMSEYYTTTNKFGVTITEEGIQKICNMYHQREEVDDISKNVSIESIASNQYNLCTLQYVMVNDDMLMMDIDVDLLIKRQEEQKKRLLKYNELLNDLRGRFLLGE